MIAGINRRGWKRVQGDSGRSWLRAFTLVEPFERAGGRPPAVRKGDRGAFTLIELLVVIAIIALLVSIVVPSLTQAKKLAHKSVCLSNLHGIGAAAMQAALTLAGYINSDSEDVSSVHFGVVFRVDL